jgi:hypothetical protein
MISGAEIGSIVVGSLIALLALPIVAYLVYKGTLSMDVGMACFIAAITTMNLILSICIPHMPEANAKKNASIAIVSLNSITIFALLLYLGLATYFKFQKTSIQTTYKYIHILIPASIIISMVSLSATAMKQLTKAGSSL